MELTRTRASRGRTPLVATTAPSCSMPRSLMASRNYIFGQPKLPRGGFMSAVAARYVLQAGGRTLRPYRLV